jgi:hypothetical protein
MDFPVRLWDIPVDIWGSSPDDIFMITGFGAVFHRSGGLWTKELITRRDFLLSVWGRGPDDVFVVGLKDFDLTGSEALDGVIFHYNGDAWTSFSPVVNEALFEIWGPASGNAYLTGASSGGVYELDGKSLQQIFKGTGNGAGGIWGSSSGNIFVGSVDGLIMYYHDSEWHLLQTGASGDIGRISGCNATDVYAVAWRWDSENKEKQGEILHWDGMAWEVVFSQNNTMFMDLFCAGADDVYVVGTVSGEITLGDRGIILHYNGVSWSEVELGSLEPLFAVWGTGPENVYAVGAGPTVLHYQP